MRWLVLVLGASALIGLLLSGCATAPARSHDVDLPLEAHRFVV